MTDTANVATSTDAAGVSRRPAWQWVVPVSLLMIIGLMPQRPCAGVGLYGMAVAAPLAVAFLIVHFSVTSHTARVLLKAGVMAVAVVLLAGALAATFFHAVGCGMSS